MRSKAEVKGRPSAVSRAPVELTREPSRRSVDSPSEPQKIHSPLSVHNLSNPALAEIPSRKFNVLRESSASRSNSPATIPQTAPDPRDSGHSRAGLSPSIAPPTVSSSSIAHLKARRSLPGLDLRSPQQKRPPASHSSYGIETANGPPPALSTQRSLLHEKFRRPFTLDLSNLRIHRPFSLSSNPASRLEKVQPSPSTDAVVEDDPSGATALKRELSNSSRKSDSTDSKVKMSATTTFVGSTLRNDKGQPGGGVEMQNANDSGRGSSLDETRSKNEDVFLNIAKSNVSRRDSAGRRSRFGFSALSSRSSRAVEQTSSAEQSRFNDQNTQSHSQDASPSVPYSPLSFDEHSRLRYFGVGSSSRSTVELPHNRLSQASQDISPDLPERRASLRDTRTYRQSNLSVVRNTRQPSKSDAAERPRPEMDRPRQDGTESTLSTTAPSSVWDELDDLKSRIRKLELTGKLPASSAAAMSNASGERPRTATTTVTTVSSSPKQGRKPSPPSGDSEATTTTNQIHPLLHSALAKAKPVVSTEVYRALEATATDALTLANMLGANTNISSSASVVNGYNSSERQAKRKADSMCRSLTELCLALSDERLISLPKKRPASGDVDQPNGADNNSRTTIISYRRGVSHEPEEVPRPQTTSRIPSRLEVRRASTINLGTANGSCSPQDPLPSQTPTFSTPPSRLSRLSSLRTRRQQGEENSDDRPRLIDRSVSRAMTEIGNSNSNMSPQQQQQAQPRTPITPTTPSSIPLRRNYPSTTNHIRTTSNVNVQPGFRRYGFNSGISQGAREDAQGATIEVNESLRGQVSRTRIVMPSILARGESASGSA
ncbi:hypothetical protein VTN00DRAFT_2161 [Thermoascus crustaceus]|uniref:uncharacterized protein n=1 Tax=Thermoascus crustaceus TaxID=5088 RepID=UPI0037431368